MFLPAARAATTTSISSASSPIRPFCVGSLGFLRPSSPMRPDLVAGTELGGVVIATAVSQLSNIPMIAVRKKPKAYGAFANDYVEGPFEAGQHALLLEDVVTNGRELLEAAARLRELGLKVTPYAVISRGLAPVSADSVLASAQRPENGKLKSIVCSAHQPGKTSLCSFDKPFATAYPIMRQHEAPHAARCHLTGFCGGRMTAFPLLGAKPSAASQERAAGPSALHDGLAWRRVGRVRDASPVALGSDCEAFDVMTRRRKLKQQILYLQRLCGIVLTDGKDGVEKIGRRIGRNGSPKRLERTAAAGGKPERQPFAPAKRHRISIRSAAVPNRRNDRRACERSRSRPGGVLREKLQLCQRTASHIHQHRRIASLYQIRTRRAARTRHGRARSDDT